MEKDAVEKVASERRIFPRGSCGELYRGSDRKFAVRTVTLNLFGPKELH